LCSAACAVIEDGEPRLLRVDYDIEATVADLNSSGLAPEFAEPLGRILPAGTL
jgi:hypothetical protein